ncbi:hypothetical protein KDA14_02180 [Candidatus Saccharibacteria bacterium]|nr:hypothetical protein [Candidatus Saccharibacteria bacterium]
MSKHKKKSRTRTGGEPQRNTLPPIGREKQLRASVGDIDTEELQVEYATLVIRRTSIGFNNALVWTTALLYLFTNALGLMGILAIIADADINVKTLVQILTVIGIICIGVLSVTAVIVYRYEHFDLTYDHSVSVCQPWIVTSVCTLIAYIGFVSLNDEYPDKDDFVEWDRYRFAMYILVVQAILMQVYTFRAFFAHRNPIAQSPYGLKMEITNALMDP